MTATVIPFPSKSVREAVLEARKGRGGKYADTRIGRMDGDTSQHWRTLSNSCAWL